MIPTNYDSLYHCKSHHESVSVVFVTIERVRYLQVLTKERKVLFLSREWYLLMMPCKPHRE